MKLFSVNQDTETQVGLEIKLLDIKEEQGQSWQYYQIELHNGTETQLYSSKEKTITTTVGTKGEIGKFAFAIAPHNELEHFKEQLNLFIQNKTASFRFEPSDPSFELIIERLPDLGEGENFKVYFWIDAGNTKSLECTWDAIGVRFITNLVQIQNFSS